MSEFELVQNVAKHLREHFPDLRFVMEAPVLGRSVDLAILRGNRVISIEFKLKDWKRGISQARDYCLASDLSYICLPKLPITERLSEEARSAGVGVLIVDFDSKWPFRTMTPATPSKEKWKVAARALRQYIKEATNGKKTKAV